ncbi:MAG: beta-galactosidase, partial [Ruminococcaceae bacterium]|nr:beta-galactosidase [Oscillospiraceae bacterium]
MKILSFSNQKIKIPEGKQRQMRKEVIINKGWFFTKNSDKGNLSCTAQAQKVDLPHTYNAYDGQDGGADYFRGECRYFKEIEFSKIMPNRLYYIEFGAVASECTVYINGREATRHAGGYSKFRANITPYITDGKNSIEVCVSNAPNDYIYPQMADFTFFGGIHRDVKLIEVESTHFDLDYFGSCGLEAYSDINESGGAVLFIKSYVVGAKCGDTVRYSLTDGEGKVVAEVFSSAQNPEISLPLDKVRLWNGVKDPYLYGISAQIIRRNEVLDNVCILHGFRSFFVDSQKGFFLNGEHTPLRGVSRHGDRHNKGLALSLEDHIRDAALISEVGANTVRLAHYQHAEEFYELCDRYGFIVWAEIPFISKMLANPQAHENCISQMKELIIQNFNHPSICFWGISNEITIGGASDTLVRNLHSLNDLVHSMDKTRVSTMAQVSMLPMEDEQNQITDILAYNHYFGWYGGELSDNEKWFDSFHKKYPDRALGISEYGCEGIITYHNTSPKMGDYSEEYQALYHEHMLKLLEERPWIWGSYVWNM